MAPFAQVQAANRALSKSGPLTAVFAGATSGIGLNTLKAFATHVRKPTAIIIGRSRKSFEPQLAALSQINPDGRYTFLESDISLLHNVDSVSTQIKSLLPLKQKIDLLFLSQGYISFAGREDNADGLDNSISLRYYGRILFTQNLLPVLSPSARIVSVLGGGKEGKVAEDDLDLAKPGAYTFASSAGQFATMTTLSFDHFATGQSAQRGFLQVYPGLVSTGLLGKSATGLLGLFLRWVVEPIANLFALKPEEAGERMLHYATSDKYGAGSWSLDWDGTPKNVADLQRYRKEGLTEKVARHNERVFEKAVARL
ncbi:hypothetical protein ANO11243_055640 [Dothideomycetidae sp. 11243]|nr:hypothetical protein ANO11243_055640 [fungal sp. No.11243]